MRGHPYTAHWFIWHDRDGAIDLEATSGLAGYPASDVDCAASVRLMLESAGTALLHGAQTGRWYLWDGTRYARQDEDFASRMATQAANWLWTAMRDVAACQQLEIARLPQDQQKAAADAAKARWRKQLALRSRVRDSAGYEALLRQLARACTQDESAMDAGTGEIVLGNGRVSIAQVLRDGYVRLIPHERSSLVTRRAAPGLAWDPQARAPWFSRFLATSVADPEQRFWLMWRTASALFGRMPRKGFVNLIGERDSGKSTFTKVISLLAGDYATSVPPETFLARHTGDAGFRQAELRGARFTCSHEPSPGARYDESLMKTLTGRDRQRTAGKYEKPVEWTPQLTIFIGSNSPVRFASSDEAFMSRQEVVRFAAGYELAVEDIDAILARELPGILVMLMDTLLWEAANRGKPELPQSAVDERERMAEETEDALEFVREWTETGLLTEKDDVPAYRCATVVRMYQWYRSWCEDAGVRPLGRKTFAAVVGRRYPRARSGGVWHFTGLVAR